MSFIDDSITNLKNSVLKEVSAGGATGGFVGRGGVEIDQLYAGGYHPDSGHGSQNLQLLTKQIEDRKKKRAEMEKQAYKDGVELVGNASPIGGYFDVETEIALAAYEELGIINQQVKQYNDENTPPQDTEWENIDNNIYDDIYIHIDDEENFINQSEKNMKKVGIDIEYDDNIPTYDKEDFINRSQTNWKLVGRK